MRKEAIINYVQSLIDEISPTELVGTMNYGKTVEAIMQSVADEYAMKYPVDSVITKTFPIPSSDFSSHQINGACRVKGTRLTIPSEKYAKFRELVIAYGVENAGREVRINTLLPADHKKRKYIIGDNLESMPYVDAVAFVASENNPEQGGKIDIDVYPELEINGKSQIKYDMKFDPVHDAIFGGQWTDTFPTDDRGFYDNYCWYLAFRSMEVMGAETSMIQTAQQKVQAHFELVTNLP